MHEIEFIVLTIIFSLKSRQIKNGGILIEICGLIQSFDL